jgi:hypothetical protein
VLSKWQPPRTTLRYSLPSPIPTTLLQGALEALADDTRFTYSPLTSSSRAEGRSNGFIVKASIAVWSRTARRKRERDNDLRDDSQPPSKRAKFEAGSSAVSTWASEPVETTQRGLLDWAMICTVRLVDGTLVLASQGVELQWVYGRDRMIFESFSGHISKRLGVLSSGSL